MTLRGIVLTQKDKMTGVSLNAILLYVGLPSRIGTHNALDDVKLEAEVLSRLLYGKNLLPEFARHSLPEYCKQKLK